MATNSKEYMKAWRQNHPGKMKAYDDKWRAANPEAAKKSDRKKCHKFYHAHPEYRAKTIARFKRWAKENPERVKENWRVAGHAHRARKLATTVGPVSFREVLKDSCGICGICHKPLDEKLDYDHIIPLDKGGTHTQDNLQATHASCNRRKNARLDYVHVEAVI